MGYYNLDSSKLQDENTIDSKLWSPVRTCHCCCYTADLLRAGHVTHYSIRGFSGYWRNPRQKRRVPRVDEAVALAAVEVEVLFHLVECQ